MKNLRYILIIQLAFALLFSGCKEEDTNPVFTDDAIPRIFGWSTDNIYTTNITDTLSIGLKVSPSEGATYEWTVDGQSVGNSTTLEYLFSEPKSYAVKFAVTRNGVTNSREAEVIVIKPFVPKTYTKKMVGFLTGAGTLADVDMANLTHLVISSAVVGQIEGSEAVVDTSFAAGMGLSLLVKAAHNAGVYVMLDVTGKVVPVNGGGFYADYGFANVIADPAKQAKAIETIMKFATDNNLDGVNLYVNNSSEGSLGPVDDAKLAAFFKAVAAARPEGPNGKFFLTASVPGGWTTSAFKSIATVEEVDWVNIQPYRYEDLAPTDHGPLWAANDLAATWMSFGLPKEKIVIGFPAFGLHYFMPKDGTEVGWGNLWMFTAYKSFKEILTLDANAHTKDKLDVDDGIYYDGHPKIQQKAQLVLDNDFGGLMIWSLESDTRAPEKSLLKTANAALGN
ncbi:MAG TPA: glycosyl hydrolase family 18 protein [Cytophagales bacterium]|nr:glycosyl hydrolase family 18 protein [Cytophagales bacterium]